MHFLLVDDERTICEGTAQRLRAMALPQITEISCAFSGEEALARLRRGGIDILLTDIRMGEMDGLELIRQAKYLMPALICIIITAYDQFQYAQRALQLGVEDFWVKPYSERSMRESILAIIRRLEQQRMRTHRQLDLAINEAILGGSQSACAVFAESGEAFPEDALRVVAWRNEGPVLTPPAGVWHYQPEGKRYLLVSSPPCDGSPLQHWLCDLCAQLRQSVGISGQGLELSQMARQAQQALLADWVWQEPRPLFYQAEDPFWIQDEGIRKTIRHIRSFHTDTVKQDLATLLQPDAPLFEQRAVALYTALQQTLQGLCTGEALAPPSPGAGWRMAFEHLFLIADRCKRAQLHASKGNPVAWAKQYVQAHWTDNIDMAVVANELNVSYPYFSKLFREQTGQTFSDYIQEIRMHEACRMLLQGERINDISAKLGYQNANNFTRAFRKSFGVSPQRFRKEGML